MKKLVLVCAATLLLGVAVQANDMDQQYFDRTQCQETHLDMEYKGCIHLLDGGYLLNVDDVKYIHIAPDGTETAFTSDYTVVRQNPDGNLIISKMETVDVSNKFLGFGDTLEATKYGVMSLDGTVLIAPILDNVINAFAPYELTFPNGFSRVGYGATSFTYGEGMASHHQHKPDNEKPILISTNYKTWKDYDAFYENFVTDNRYIVKDNGISHMIDREMNVITDKYTHIIELDDGKWYASTDPSQTAPVYSVVLDNDGNVLTNFDPKLEKVTSDWAKPYLAKAEDLGIITQEKTTAFNASFCTKEITRNEFCRLAVNTLTALNFVVPETETAVSFTDTQDENVLLLSNLGVINGVGNGKFNPYANITREEAAKILLNLADLLGYDTSKQTASAQFADLSQVSTWAVDYVLQISALRTQTGEAIMGGTSATTFAPQDTYTVEQAVTTLVRMTEIP